jgi:hypothetical protein
MSRRLRPLASGAIVFASLVGLAAMMVWDRGSLPPPNVALLFVLPSVLLLGTDWATGGFSDNDFALGADIVLLVSGAGVYAVLLVLARRMASLLTRQSPRAATMGAAAYLLAPPVAIGGLLAAGGLEPFTVVHADPAVVAAATAGLLYVLLDAFLGLLARSADTFWPWALPANARAYGLLWLSQVSLAVLAELTLPQLGLLSVVLFSLLLVLLRVAYGFMRRVLQLYTATAEALTAALEATLLTPGMEALPLADAAYRTARALGFPQEDASLVQSASLLESIVGQGFPSSGAGGVLERDHAALVDSLRIVEAAERPDQEMEPRFLRLAFVLHATNGAAIERVQQSASASVTVFDRVSDSAQAAVKSTALNCASES